MSSQEENLVECPVCFKEFSSKTIETHVGRCLFLNETTSDSPKETSKRSLLSQKGSPVIKRPKLNFEDAESSASSSNKQSNNETQNSSFKNISVKDCAPLAEKMRPSDLLSYVGQTHVLGPDSVLYKLLSNSEIPNVILWGPPGCGKTSLANVIANICKHCPGGKYRYVKLSAAMSGVNDVKDAITIASNELKFGRRTVMFMDEIHRFNKSQQDTFLPHIESGTITLIGATTENPSFSLNSALLSRCRVMVLDKLSVEDLTTILEKAAQAMDGVIVDSKKKTSVKSKKSCKFLMDQETIKWLAETSDGDARIALGGLELAIQSKVINCDESLSQDPCLISLDDIKDGLKKTHMLYDRKGDNHYDMISALHKSVRASDENASIYWLSRMMAGGEDPVYIARRLVRAASEDVGLEDPKALGMAVNTMHACKMLGMPECDVLLAQCTTYLARAPKSRLMEDALRAAQRLVATYKGAQPAVPLHLRNAPTKLMKKLGYGKGYNMLQKEQSGLNYLPEEISDVDFFKGKEQS